MSTSSDVVPVRLGLVGLGYWGPNLARNIARLPGAELAWCCDLDPANRARFGPQFPTTRFTEHLEDLTSDPDLDGIVVATGAASHARLGRIVLEAGKHCFVEKPLALTVEDARELVDLARERDRRLMVGHLLRFHPAFRWWRSWPVPASSAGCSTCTPTASTSGRCGRTRTPSGASPRTTSRWPSPSPASARARCRPAARASCATASRTSPSPTWPSRRA